MNVEAGITAIAHTVNMAALTNSANVELGSHSRTMDPGSNGSDGGGELGSGGDGGGGGKTPVDGFPLGDGGTGPEA